MAANKHLLNTRRDVSGLGLTLSSGQKALEASLVVALNARPAPAPVGLASSHQSFIVSYFPAADAYAQLCNAAKHRFQPTDSADALSRIAFPSHPRRPSAFLAIQQRPHRQHEGWREAAPVSRPMRSGAVGAHPIDGLDRARSSRILFSLYISYIFGACRKRTCGTQHKNLQLQNFLKTLS